MLYGSELKVKYRNDQKTKILVDEYIITKLLECSLLEYDGGNIK